MENNCIETRQVISQDNLLLEKLINFYTSNPEYIKIVLNIVTGDSISLRLIDWFATNYAKKNDICYFIESDDESNEKKRINVYHSYKLKLKSNGKVRFDPFCRAKRIYLPYENDKKFETTIGQLNFFKWIIENKILDYINKNINDIKNDMEKRGSISKKRDTNDNNKTRKKREELSISALKSIKKEDIEIILKFN